MTVHRTRLVRSAALGAPTAASAPHRAGEDRPSRSRRVLGALAARLGSERGDVPGWVLITLMTAGIVIALWAVASDQIVQIFENAMAPFLSGSL